MCTTWGGGGTATAAGRVHLYLPTPIRFTDLANKSGLLVSTAIETANNEVR